VWDLIARDGASAGFTKVGTAAERAGMQTEAAGKKINGLGTSLLGVGLVLGAGEMVKSAVKFQSNMLLLQTQAGQSSESVKEMSKSVLGLAGATGTAPDELATSLYHVVSTGLKGAAALDAVKIAAEGAKVGHADLESTTNALTAAIASGIPGVQNMSSAMGSLNAIVGAGDMKMQDLNDAMGSGVLTVVKGYGLSLNDVGAALATFGDNNIRGADAATMLRMAVQSFAKPAVAGTQALKDMGLTTTQLRDDMSKGGLNSALQDLVAHMQASGVKATEVGGILTEIFGKKAGPGIAVLVSQFDRFETKTKEVAAGGKTFGESWNTWLKSNQGQMDLLRGKTEAVGIEIGNKLLPVLNSTVGFVNDNSTALIGLGVGLVGVKVAITGVKVATELWSAATVAVRAVVAGTETAYIASLYAMEAAQKRFNMGSLNVGGMASGLGQLGLAGVGVAQQIEQTSAAKSKLDKVMSFGVLGDVQSIYKGFFDTAPKATKAVQGVGEAMKFATAPTAANAKALVAATSAVKDNNAVTPEMAALVDQAKQALAGESAAALDLSSTFKTLNGGTLDAKSAQLAFLDSVQSVTDSVKQNGTSLDDNTDAGRKNEEAIIASIKAAQAHAVAMQQAGASAANAGQHFLADEAALRKQALAAGLSKDQVDALIKKYGQVPASVMTEIKLEKDAATAKAAAWKTYLANLPKSVAVSVEVNGVSAAEFELQNLARNRTATITTIASTVYQQTPHGKQGFASGGYLPVGLSNVGEQGQETVEWDGHSAPRVRSASDTNRMGGGGGNTFNLYVTSPLGTPEQIAAALIPALERAAGSGKQIHIARAIR
jgi:TP901 family phage tail tape measure protein